MSDIHAGPDTHHPGDGLCTWVENSFGQHLHCDEPLTCVTPCGQLNCPRPPPLLPVVEVSP